MSKLRFNILIDLEYNNKELDKVTPIDWCTGLDDIIKEEFTPEMQELDPTVKVTVETVMQNPERISIEELLKKGSWESAEDVDNYIKQTVEKQKDLVKENEQLKAEKDSLIQDFKDILWDTYLENPIREEIFNQLQLIEDRLYVRCRDKDLKHLDFSEDPHNIGGENNE